MIGQTERILELKRLRENQNEPGLNKIFAFTSGKGGTGKTFLSLNLAYSLAEQGKKVLLVDLDSNLSNANIMLNIVATKTIYDFYTEKKLLKDVITEVKPNLHFVFGDSGKLNYPDAHDGLIFKLHSQIISLQNAYDFIFFDTGSGAGKSIVNILLKAGSVVIVTSPEPTAVMDSYVMLKLLNAANFKGEKFVIVNKSIGEDDGRSTFNNLSIAADHFLKNSLTYLGNVQFDMVVSKSIIAQELVIKKHPESEVSKQIKGIRDSINEITHMANIHHTAIIQHH